MQRDQDLQMSERLRPGSRSERIRDRRYDQFSLERIRYGLTSEQDSRYLAGLWEDILIEDLDYWYEAEPATKTKSVDCPSWFWAFTKSTIYFDFIDDSETRYATVADIKCVKLKHSACKSKGLYSLTIWGCSRSRQAKGNKFYAYLGLAFIARSLPVSKCLPVATER